MKGLDCKIIVVLIIACLISLNGFSQEEKFEQVGKDIDLNGIICMLQDNDGYMWFGTWRGLYKYDGYHFKYYEHIPNDSTTISGNRINAMLLDKNGTLWIGTDEGLNLYNKTKDQFKNPYIEKLNKDDKQVWGGICEIGNDFILYGTNKGLRLFNKQKGIIVKKYKKDTGDVNGFKSDRVNSIISTKNSEVFIGTSDGLYLNNAGNAKFIKLLNESVSCIYSSDTNKIYIGTKSGLYIYENNKIEHFKHDSLKGTTILRYKDNLGNLYVSVQYESAGHQELYKIKPNGDFLSLPVIDGKKSISITSMIKDKSGVLWISSYNGLFKYSKSRNLFKIHENSSKILNSEKSMCFYIDALNSIWLGTHNYGVYNINSDGQYKNYRHDSINNNGISDNFILKIAAGDDLSSIIIRSGKTLFQDGKKIYRTDGIVNELNVKNGEIIKIEKECYSIYSDKQKNIWFGTLDGLYRYNRNNKTFKHFIYNKDTSDRSANFIVQIFEDKKGILWIGTFDDGLKIFDRKNEVFTDTFKTSIKKNSISDNHINAIFEDNSGIIWIGTSRGISKFDRNTKTFINFNTDDGLINNDVFGILEDKKGFFWIMSSRGLSKFDFNRLIFTNYKMDIECEAGFQKDNKGNIFFISKGKLYYFSPENDININRPKVLLTDFKVFDKSIKFNIPITEIKEITIPYNENFFAFEFSAFDFNEPDKNQYEFILEGIDKDWQYSKTVNIAKYTNISPGSYSFKVRASNNDGIWNNNYLTVKLIITPPWWQTIWFRIIIIIIIISVIIFYIRLREKKLQKEKEKLEMIVKERTLQLSDANEELNQQNDEIRAQRDEIEAQRDEIIAQRDLVTNQKEQIEKIHHEVSQSINYATRIQTAILPEFKLLENVISEHFVLFKPKDKVSGDFYWWAIIEKHLIVTVADCTGHGVPGAFMSMLGTSFLREIVLKEYITSPSIILKRLRKEIIQTLKQKGEYGEQKDGMDMALVSINLETLLMQYSGANNPLYLIKNTIANNPELIEYQPDKMPVAIYENMSPYTNQEIKLNKGDCIYLMSDGYQDQFGGQKRKKFLSKNLKELLKLNCNFSMQIQKELLEKSHNDWKGNGEQIDDVTVMGIKI